MHLFGAMKSSPNEDPNGQVEYILDGDPRIYARTATFEYNI